MGGAVVLGAAVVVGATVVDATVVDATVVGATVLGATVVGATTAALVGAAVAGAGLPSQPPLLSLLSAPPSPGSAAAAASRIAMICPTCEYGQPCGQVARQGRQGLHRLPVVAGLDVAELLAGRADDAVVGLQQLDLVLEVAVHGLELAELVLEPVQLPVLVEPRAHREQEQCGADRERDRQAGEAEQEAQPTASGDPVGPWDTPPTADVAEARTPRVARPTVLRARDGGRQPTT